MHLNGSRPLKGWLKAVSKSCSRLFLASRMNSSAAWTNGKCDKSKQKNTTVPLCSVASTVIWYRWSCLSQSAAAPHGIALRHQPMSANFDSVNPIGRSIGVLVPVERMGLHRLGDFKNPAACLLE